jgi:hypothetical protein
MLAIFFGCRLFLMRAEIVCYDFRKSQIASEPSCLAKYIAAPRTVNDELCGKGGKTVFHAPR